MSKNQRDCWPLLAYYAAKAERQKQEANAAAFSKVLGENPILSALVGATIGVLLIRPTEVPAWAKQLEPVNLKKAGPWRGKGSFGKGFGPQERHK